VQAPSFEIGRFSKVPNHRLLSAPMSKGAANRGLLKPRDQRQWAVDRRGHGVSPPRTSALNGVWTRDSIAMPMGSNATTNTEDACLGVDTLAEFAERRLPAHRQALAEKHVLNCPNCQLVAADFAALIASSSRDRAEVESLEPGMSIGRYVVVKAVGAGAMGSVYAAYDPDLDRRVALKLLRSRSDSEELRSRLLREAKAMARLSHPSVITVHDVGEYSNRLFIAMEFIEGGTLRDWLARNGPKWREALQILVRAGRGLAAAHAAGLVHRDFKPDNVLVGHDGRVRVTDFGLARGIGEDDVEPPSGATAHDPLDATITRTGALVGTPAYMAPERFGGAAADARADMFSFCVTRCMESVHLKVQRLRGFANRPRLARCETRARVRRFRSVCGASS
jgi:tRNA A-37 threonylcarbamoyl transferase component Bud32